MPRDFSTEPPHGGEPAERPPPSGTMLNLPARISSLERQLEELHRVLAEQGFPTKSFQAGTARPDSPEPSDSSLR